MSSKVKKLQKELRNYQDKLKHMSAEFAATKEGSAYGCEYYEIQCRVLLTMIQDTQAEILKTKKEEKLL
ncbi:hypothetical protein KKD37_00040 [Patescibacteria group bacterium]|nr:hypothetical protein [Patescibacteria group bacterium]